MHARSQVFCAAVGWFVGGCLATDPTGSALADPGPVELPEGTICGASGDPPERLEHVIVILMENKDTADVAWNPSAPYFSSLLDQCGSSSAFLDDIFVANLPSLPHYLALTSGSNCDSGIGTSGSGCITSDAGPSSGRLHTASIFEQVGSWRAYEEDMPSPCDWARSEPGTHYAAKHNPPVYYANLADCGSNDLPMSRISCPSTPNATCSAPRNVFVDDLWDDQLAEYTFLMPDLVNSMHDGSVAQGDNWLHTYLPVIFASAPYRRGGTAVYVLWDEQRSSSGGPTPNLFISPFVGHTVSGTPMNLIAVLRAIEDQLGVPTHLGCAGGTPPGGIGSCPVGSTADLRSIFAF